jgi:hypothetical protein
VPALVPAGPALALAGDLPAGVLEEVAAAVGADPGEVQVRPAFTGATTGVTFEVVRAGADPVPALTMVVSTGQEGALLLAAHRRRGTPLPGVGDEAWTGPGWSLARSGDVTVRVGRSAQGRADDAALPLVLRAALATAGGRLRTSGAPAAPPPGP